ncbi:hypothetical protein HJC23_013599 [Cyclotella cryptica]|uniref:PDZ domain-containing protein n=1 Tax=Cyclotella cryptica TaxID=29204 RepID=A0ABD3PPH0_9STRA|eukprot:CCRYP_012575-RA/>CCRYP_012575-RA protein AED:0.04 eAED:0.04 QI:320/1/1/1/1/1/4/329/874
MMHSSLILYFTLLSQDVLLVVFLATCTTTTPSYAFSSSPLHVKSRHHSKWPLHRCRNRKNHDAVSCQPPCRSACERHGGAMYRHRWHADTSFSFPLHLSIDNDNNDNDSTDGTSRDFVDNSTSISDTNTKQDESGWVSNFGKYLLPPSWSLSLSRNASPSSPPPGAAINPPTNVDVSTYDPNSREMADPIFLEGSTFSKASSVEGEAALAAAKMEECSVIDVECYVEEEEVPEDEEKEIVSSSSDSPADVSNRLRGVVRRIRDRFKRNVAKEKEKSVLEDHSDVNVLSLPERNLQSAEGIKLNASSNDTAPVADNEDPFNSAEELQEQSTIPDNPIPTQSATEGIPKRQKRSRRGHKTSTNHPPPIFHSLETNDIDTATQFKQKKWQRRRKRAAMLLTTLKNAAFLFVITFLAGNVMNQFVDLTEDGSFEVHFGKSLSTPSPPSPLPPSPPPQRSPPLQTGVEKRRSGNFRAMMKPSRTSPTTQYDARAETLGLVSRAVRRVGPAVVRVETETDVNTRNGDPSKGEVGDDEETRGDIFDGVPEAPSQGSSDDAKTIDFGQGSGMIIKREDEFHILTNAHVVDGATRVYVLLTDGRRFRAELCGKDDIVDVAVLKIIPEEDEEGVEGSDSMLDLPVAELGDSDRLEVGQFVTAIGSPGGLDNSCTIGIVSGLKRCPKVVGIPDKAGVLQYIQTDAAINQGNSGGPLVDVESGDIVGINTCIRANMEGTSFAIPINKVLGILDDLYEGKHISHGYLGVQMSTMNPTLARYYNKLQERSDMKIPEKDGVIIEKVFKKSPAEVGGLKKYDFVCEIDGQRVSNAEDAHLIIDQAPIGKDLCITLMRGDSEVTVHVKPEDLSVRLKQLREERLKRKKVNT